MDSIAQLSRTILLFQTDLEISNSELILQTLCETTVQLVATDEINTFEGQVAVSTAALLMARSGCKVYIDTPGSSLLGHQPPFTGNTFHQTLQRANHGLMDEKRIVIGRQNVVCDVEFKFGVGNSIHICNARRSFAVGWTNWSACISAETIAIATTHSNWPIGALTAAVLVAAEATKIAGLKLAEHSRNSVHFKQLFNPASTAKIVLAPENTPLHRKCGRFDLISAGAVSNAFLYSLLRIPSVSGNGRVFDGDVSDWSNMNRNMLLTPMHIGKTKVEAVHHFENGLLIDPVRRHFVRSDIADLQSHVAVGVDDIPIRWLLASANAKWMGVGATSHFDSMASSHFQNCACAACLHSKDEYLAGATPTIAFSSFLAGLVVAADFLTSLSGSRFHSHSYYRYMSALSGSTLRWPVHPISRCPSQCNSSRQQAA